MKQFSKKYNNMRFKILKYYNQIHFNSTYATVEILCSDIFDNMTTLIINDNWTELYKLLNLKMKSEQDEFKEYLMKN
jgi:hypothetical protein